MNINAYLTLFLYVCIPYLTLFLYVCIPYLTLFLYVCLPYLTQAGGRAVHGHQGGEGTGKDSLTPTITPIKTYRLSPTPNYYLLLLTHIPIPTDTDTQPTYY
jgi:hypothetical protein